MTKQEASAKIAALLKQGRDSMEEAAALAEDAGLEFEYRNPDDSGGKYVSYAVAEQDWEPSDSCEWEESFTGYDGENYGWISSSSQC